MGPTNWNVEESKQVLITGPNSLPKKQCKYTTETESRLQETISTLLELGLVVKQQSTNNTPIWPVRRAGEKTWRLTVDYRALNKISPMTATVVAKYPKVMAAIARGAKWSSVLNLSDALFAISHKLAFRFRGRQYTFTWAL